MINYTNVTQNINNYNNPDYYCLDLSKTSVDQLQGIFNSAYFLKALGMLFVLLVACLIMLLIFHIYFVKKMKHLHKRGKVAYYILTLTFMGFYMYVGYMVFLIQFSWFKIILYGFGYLPLMYISITSLHETAKDIDFSKFWDKLDG